MNTYIRTLTIAGSDSGGGAGVQADLKTFAALGTYGMTVITALTAQNTREVRSIAALSPAFVGDQIDVICEDIGVDGVKIGMLFEAKIIEVVASRLKRHKIKKVILDPVMVAKSGDILLKTDAIDALKRLLLPLTEIFTPNIKEAEILLNRSIKTAADAKQAAVELRAFGAQAVLVKGGHFEESPEAVDELYSSSGLQSFSASRITTQNTHGTGCTLSAAICAYRAKDPKPLHFIAPQTKLTGRGI